MTESFICNNDMVRSLSALVFAVSRSSFNRNDDVFRLHALKIFVEDWCRFPENVPDHIFVDTQTADELEVKFVNMAGGEIVRLKFLYLGSDLQIQAFSSLSRGKKRSHYNMRLSNERLIDINKKIKTHFRIASDTHEDNDDGRKFITAKVEECVRSIELADYGDEVLVYVRASKLRVGDEKFFVVVVCDDNEVNVLRYRMSVTSASTYTLLIDEDFDISVMNKEVCVQTFGKILKAEPNTNPIPGAEAIRLFVENFMSRHGTYALTCWTDLVDGKREIDYATTARRLVSPGFDPYFVDDVLARTDVRYSDLFNIAAKYIKG